MSLHFNSAKCKYITFELFTIERTQDQSCNKITLNLFKCKLEKYFANNYYISEKNKQWKHIYLSNPYGILSGSSWNVFHIKFFHHFLITKKCIQYWVLPYKIHIVDFKLSLLSYMANMSIYAITRYPNWMKLWCSWRKIIQQSESNVSLTVKLLLIKIDTLTFIQLKSIVPTVKKR